MGPDFFGTEQVTDEDRAYRGSRFSEVRDAIFANPYQKVWGRAGEPPLPIYSVSLPSALRGILPLGSPYFDRPLFDLLHCDAARPRTIIVPSRQTLSHDGPEPQRTPRHGKFHHAAGYRR